MRLARILLERMYAHYRNELFEASQHHPLQAHDAATLLARFLAGRPQLARFLLDYPAAHEPCVVEIGNAAGTNKDGLLPPLILKLLGFDSATIGTVGHDPWPGNPAPTARRYPPYSLVNWPGLPGMGSPKIREILDEYGSHCIPYNINIASTPGKSGEAEIEDIAGTIEDLLPHIDRAELNISCPNTAYDRTELQKTLDNKLTVVERTGARWKPWRLKLSPDATREDYARILDVCRDHSFVTGFVCFNTTTQYDPHYLSPVPTRGGASGDALYELACRQQREITQLLGRHSDQSWDLVACGGIRTLERAHERRRIGPVKGIQFYTPAIYDLGVIRTLREDLQTA